jgi:hypothetical protein
LLKALKAALGKREPETDVVGHPVNLLDFKARLVRNSVEVAIKDAESDGGTNVRANHGAYIESLIQPVAFDKIKPTDHPAAVAVPAHLRIGTVVEKLVVIAYKDLVGRVEGCHNDDLTVLGVEGNKPAGIASLGVLGGGVGMRVQARDDAISAIQELKPVLCALPALLDSRVNEFANVDNNLASSRMVQVQDAELTASGIAEKTVLVDPGVGIAHDCHKIGRDGGYGLPALYKPSQLFAVTLTVPSNSGFK